MQKESISFIILAAGMGTRMKSKTPKVLHNLAGEPIIFHILRKILSLSKKIILKKIIVVLGHESELVKNSIIPYFPNIEFVIQSKQCGTAHAVLAAEKTLKNSSGKVLILCGDTPLISTKLILDLIKLSNKVDLGVSVFKAEKPFGYGRIILDKFNKVTSIIEEKDANKSQKMVNLCNAGIYISDINLLFRLLSKVKTTSNKREMYLTDIVDIANNKNIYIGASYSEEIENIGINNRESLAMAEKEFQNILRSKFMKNGVTLIAPETVFFSHDTKIAKDVYIAPNVVFGPRVKIGEGVRIEAFCHLEGVTIKKDSIIGPFARLRPGTILEESTKVGNFVEIKNSKVKKGSKVNHLSYVGDSNIGANVNIGAGAITCNYDGVNKNKTNIGNNSFIGSNVSLVAPLKLGSNILVGAGSVITKDVPNNMLAVERNKQSLIKKKKIKKTK